VYGLAYKAGLVLAVYMIILTLSIGAQIVLAIAPEIAPKAKFKKKLSYF